MLREGGIGLGAAKVEKSSDEVAYITPSDDSVLGQQILGNLSVLSQVRFVFLFAERGPAADTDGETIQSPLLRGFNGRGRLAGRG